MTFHQLNEGGQREDEGSEVREPYLLRLRLERGGQHVGEELQDHRKQELHEGNNDEDQEGEESEDVSASPQELGEHLHTKCVS